MSEQARKVGPRLTGAGGTGKLLPAGSAMASALGSAACIAFLVVFLVGLWVALTASIEFLSSVAPTP